VEKARLRYPVGQPVVLFGSAWFVRVQAALFLGMALFSAGVAVWGLWGIDHPGSGEDNRAWATAVFFMLTPIAVLLGYLALQVGHQCASGRMLRLDEHGFVTGSARRPRRQVEWADVARFYTSGYGLREYTKFERRVPLPRREAVLGSLDTLAQDTVAQGRVAGLKPGELVTYLELWRTQADGRVE
jgi:hypothetical protein